MKSTVNLCINICVRGCEVPRRILLCVLKGGGGMCVECSKDMSVHISTSTSYGFSTLTGSCGSDKTCLFLSHCKISDQFVEQ
jgi:hypothetical protein